MPIRVKHASLHDALLGPGDRVKLRPLIERTRNEYGALADYQAGVCRRRNKRVRRVLKNAEESLKVWKTKSFVMPAGIL